MSCFAFRLLEDDYPKPHRAMVELMETCCALRPNCSQQERCRQKYNTRDNLWWCKKGTRDTYRWDTERPKTRPHDWLRHTLHIERRERVSLLG